MIPWLWPWPRHCGPVSEPPEPDDAAREIDLEPFDGPLEQIPANRAAAYRVYGDPGRGKLDRSWARRSMHTARNLPGDWNGGSGKLYCHNLAEPYLREALRRAELAGVVGEIGRLGCFNFRHQRHDSSRPLSYHSWGVALDLDSADNRARRFPRRDGPAPFSDAWRELWPDGVSEQLVECFESVGWTWGGRWTSYVDPMHFQLVG